MNKQDFINSLQEELEIEETLNEETDLKSLDEWSSLTALMLIGFVSNNFNLSLNAEDLKGITTVRSLMEFIGKENFS